MKKSFQCIAQLSFVFAFVLTSGGCVLPPPADGRYNREYRNDNGNNNNNGSYQESYSNSVDVAGKWRMNNGKYNHMQATYDGMLVTPVGRGKVKTYYKIGDNLYKDSQGTGTYEFVYTNKAIWRSNDKRNLYIELWKR